MLTRAFVLLAVLLATAGVSNAVTRTWVMEGTVSYKSADPLGLIGFVQVSDPVRLMFSFDSDTPNQSTIAGSGLYYGIAASVRAGTQDLNLIPPPHIEVNSTIDSFEVNGGITPPLPGITSGSMYFRLDDSHRRQAITDSTLPAAPYPLGLFEACTFNVNLYAPPIPPSPYRTVMSFSGDITSFYAIPEPSSLGLAFAALLACFMRNRRGVPEAL